MSDERIVDKVLKCEFKIKSMTFKAIDFLFVIAVWIFALVLRIKLFPIESADYYGFLKLWMDQIKDLGGFKSLGVAISNYSSGYMYLMSLVSGFSNSLYALKAISVLFEYAACIAVFMIIYEFTKNTTKSIIGMSVLLLSPAVILDGAYWCQCDIIYCCFILYAIYFLIKDKSILCWIFIGLAFCFKLQTMFIIPFIIIMWLKNKNIKLYQIIYVPFVYIVFQIPALIAGRPFSELMLIYFGQADYYPWGTLEYPNLYAFFDETIDSMHHTSEITGAGLYVAIIILGFVAYYIYSKNVEIDANLMITIALFTVAIAVYTLPHMHDRYGFLVDLLAVIYGVLRPSRFPITCAFSLVSILTYMPYLIAVHIFPITYTALFLLAIIVFVGYDMVKQISLKNQNPIG